LLETEIFHETSRSVQSF